MKRQFISYLAMAVLGLFVVLALASCSDGGNNGGTNPTGGGGTPNVINISGFAFSPNSITVKVGTQVTWTNNDSAPHTVTSDDSKFASSGNLSQGQSYAVTFPAAGTFPYHCVIHPSMTGTVTVTP